LAFPEVPVLHREDCPPVAVIRIDHGKVNALDADLVTTLTEALAEAERDASCKALVLTGTGSAFSAGVDLFKMLGGGDAYLERFFGALVTWFHRLFLFPKPVVAAINGHAIAGGCVMACASDYRIMAEGPGKIGIPELQVGVPFPVVSIEILRFAVSTPHLRELIYLGRTYPTDEALDRGLVDEVAPVGELLERAIETAARMGDMPAARFGITKRQLRQPALDRVERHSADTDPTVLASWKSPETHAAMRAYLEATLGRR
jgi:enoyl-CoA hydratase